MFDIGSLKSPLRPGLRALAAAGVSVASIHPMFGPDTELLSGRHVIFVDAGSPAATAAVRGLFASTMAIQVDMDLESHDRLIAYVLGLSHALNIAFFTALAESGEAAPRLAYGCRARRSTRSWASRPRWPRRIPHLYFEIQSLNDYGTESLTALLYAVERLRSVVRAGDEAGFAALMEGGRGVSAGEAPGRGARAVGPWSGLPAGLARGRHAPEEIIGRSRGSPGTTSTRPAPGARHRAARPSRPRSRG